MLSSLQNFNGIVVFNSIKKKLGGIIQFVLIEWLGYRLVKEKKSAWGIDCETTIKSLLKYNSPKILIDIGAHNGEWTKTLIELGVKLDQVFLFEPMKEYAQVLENLSLRSTTKKVFNIGIGSKEEKRNIIGGTASSSFLDLNPSKKNDFTGALTDEKELVQIKRLDDITEISSLEWVDALKIDVQGFELEVLKSAELTLKKTKFVVAELSWDEFYVGQAPAWEVIQYLYGQQFTLVDFGFHWRAGYDPLKKIIQTDAIFLNTKFGTK